MSPSAVKTPTKIWVSSFVYDTILKDQIRLLDLLPAAFDPEAPLQGRLTTHTLPKDDDDKVTLYSRADERSQLPKYDALSYAWGAPSPARKDVKPGSKYSITANQPYIEILEPNSDVTCGVILLTCNLHDALVHFRSERKPANGLFWIDAICIRQEVDDEEKSAQIENMAAIYSNAECVRIWLGKGSDEGSEALAMTCIDEILKLKNLATYSQSKIWVKDWMALKSLLQNEWFSRRWIIQEIAFARRAEVYWGDRRISWAKLATAVSTLPTQQDALNAMSLTAGETSHDSAYFGEVAAYGAKALVELIDILFRKNEDGHIMEHLLSLERLLTNLTAFNSGKPHDIVYSVMKLSNDATPVSKLRQRIADVQPEVQEDDRVSRPLTRNPTSSFVQTLYNTIDPTRLHGGSNLLSRHKARSPSAGLRKAERDYVAPAQPIVVDYQKSMHKLCSDVIDFTRRQSKSIDIILKFWMPDVRSLLNSHDKMHPDDRHKPPSWISSSTNRIYGFQPVRGNTFHTVDDDQEDPAAASRSRLRASTSSRQIGRLRRVAADPLVGSQNSGMKTYNASGHVPPKNFSIQGRTLSTKGFVLDTIAKLGQTAGEGAIPESWLQIGEWRAPLNKNLTDLEMHEPPDQFWRTLVGNRRDGDGPRVPPLIWQQACRVVFEEMPRETNASLSTADYLRETLGPNNRLPREVILPFVHRVRAVIWNRKMMKTKGRDEYQSIGLAPQEAKEGDLICILYGCSVPVVLRPLRRSKKVNASPQMPGSAGLPLKPPKLQLPTPSAQTDQANGKPNGDIDSNATGDIEEYSLIGECYLHGMMDGEAYDLPNWEKTFHIGCSPDCNCIRCE